MLPLLSVIMCTYNRKDFVSRAIESVLSQKRDFNIEIIIGDDCSSDGTRDVLTDYYKRYPDIIVLNFQPKNLGVGGNWASSVQMAKGRYLAMLDDDDYWCDENRIQQAVNFLESNDDYGVVYTNYYTKVDNIDAFTEKGKEFPTERDIVKELFSGKCCMFFPTFIIRKELINTYVDLDDYIQYRFGLQDWPTQILIGNHTKYKYFPEPSYVYRVIGESITRPKSYQNLEQRMKRDGVMYSYLLDKLPEYGKYDAEEWKRHTADRLLSLAYSKNDFKSARKYANDAYDSRKKRFANNILSFQLYILMKKIKSLT